MKEEKMSIKDEYSDLSRKIEDVFGQMRGSDIGWKISRLELANQMLFERFCPFKTGQVVRLAKTPVINEQNAHGWLGSKHFLKAGALATIAERSLTYKGDKFEYALIFETESWMDSNGHIHPVEEKNRHTYSFSEDYVEAI